MKNLNLLECSYTDEKRKNIYFWSPRAASVSILKAFYDSIDILEKAYQTLRTTGPLARRSDPWLHDYRIRHYHPQCSIKEFENNEFKKYFFARNVYDRALSSFRNSRFLFQKVEGTSSDQSFNNYLDFIINGNYDFSKRHETSKAEETLWWHSQPQVHKIEGVTSSTGDIMAKMDHIIKVEDIIKDNFDFENYGIPFIKKHFEKGNSSHHQNKSKQHKLNAYEDNPGSKEKVEEIYKEDLKFLNYTWEEFTKEE